MTEPDKQRLEESGLRESVLGILGNEDAFLELLAEVEKRLAEMKRDSSAAAVSPSQLAPSSGVGLPDAVVLPPATLVSEPAPPTQIVAHEPALPIGHNPIVQSVLYMLPWDMQNLLAPVLNTITGVRPWKLVAICGGMLVVGFATGYVAIPVTVLDKAKSYYCPVPAPAPALPLAIPPVAQPTPGQPQQ